MGQFHVGHFLPGFEFAFVVWELEPIVPVPSLTESRLGLPLLLLEGGFPHSSRAGVLVLRVHPWESVEGAFVNLFEPLISLPRLPLDGLWGLLSLLVLVPLYP
jgi:hypothetical protein